MKIITNNIGDNLMRDGIVVSARCRAEFRPAMQWTAERLSFQPQRTPDVLSTRTLKKYRYKGPAVVEIMFNADGPLWVGRLRKVSRRSAEFSSVSLREAAKRPHIAAHKPYSRR